MGCGGSKEILEECEKPLCSKMEIVDIEEVDSTFQNTSELICKIEKIRKILCDDLTDNYYCTGAWAYKIPTPEQALLCSIWRLGVDNKGKVADIGFSAENLCFEGGSNSEAGNQAANNYLNYMKNLPNEVKQEEINEIIDKLNVICEQVTDNMDNYLSNIGEKCEQNPMKGFKLCGNLKSNLAKATSALNCARGLSVKVKELIACSPNILSNCNPENFLKQNDHIVKAMKFKETENLGIAWNVVDSGHRRGKNCKAADDEYKAKLKARNEILEKMK